MSYYIEFRGEQEREEFKSLAKKAKKIMCELCEVLEEPYQERRYPYMHYRDEEDMERMDYRRGGNGRYSY